MAELKKMRTQFFPMSLKVFIASNKERFDNDPDGCMDEIIDKLETSMNEEYGTDDICQFFNIVDEPQAYERILHKKFKVNVTSLGFDPRYQVLQTNCTLTLLDD